MTESTFTPASIGETVVSTMYSAGATHIAGRRLGRHAAAGHVIALHGELGAGKTTFTQGIAEGLGIDDRVTSPTFTLVNDYAEGYRKLRLVHIDTYRLADSPFAAVSEAGTFGLEEILAAADEPVGQALGSVVVIEWAERVASMLPEDHLRVELTSVPDDEDARQLTLQANGPHSVELLRAWQADID